jgi:hypothetical protein
MLVERRDDFDALRTVVDLVKAAPQEIHFVPPAMPPVEDERRDEVSDHAAGERRYVLREVEQRP